MIQTKRLRHKGAWAAMIGVGLIILGLAAARSVVADRDTSAKVDAQAKTPGFSTSKVSPRIKVRFRTANGISATTPLTAEQGAYRRELADSMTAEKGAYEREMIHASPAGNAFGPLRAGAGMRIHLDEQGKPIVPPPGTVTPSTVRPKAYPAEVKSVRSPVAGGGIMVRNEGQFMKFSTARVGSGGKVVIECNSAARDDGAACRSGSCALHAKKSTLK